MARTSIRQVLANVISAINPEELVKEQARIDRLVKGGVLLPEEAAPAFERIKAKLGKTVDTSALIAETGSVVRAYFSTPEATERASLRLTMLEAYQTGASDSELFECLKSFEESQAQKRADALAAVKAAK